MIKGWHKPTKKKPSDENVSQNCDRNLQSLKTNPCTRITGVGRCNFLLWRLPGRCKLLVLGMVLGTNMIWASVAMLYEPRSQWFPTTFPLPPNPCCHATGVHLAVLVDRDFATWRFLAEMIGERWTVPALPIIQPSESWHDTGKSPFSITHRFIHVRCSSQKC